MKSNIFYFISTGVIALGLSFSVAANTRLEKKFTKKNQKSTLTNITNKELKKELVAHIQSTKKSKIKGSDFNFEQQKVAGFISLENGDICKVKSEVIKVPPAPGAGTKIESQVGLNLDCTR